MIKTCRQTHNTSRNIRIKQCPSQSQASHRSTKLLSELSKLLDLLNLLFTLGGSKCFNVGRHHFFVGGVSRIFGDTVIVFTGKKTRVERGPNGTTLSAVLSGRGRWRERGKKLTFRSSRISIVLRTLVRTALGAS
jgi:hypothetical protein